MTDLTGHKATHKQTKEHNTSLVLRVIYSEGPLSRADIARQTRLTRPTVSGLVGELMDDGLIEEIGPGEIAVGKPPTLVSVIDDARHVLALDLADSEFRGAVINLRGAIRHRAGLPVNDRDGDAALSLVYSLIEELMAAATSPLVGIGIGAPGLMDMQQGIVRSAVNLDWHDLPLAELLGERYQLPVYIANDSQLAALAEIAFGQATDVTNLMVVKVGRGIGAGLIINRQLYVGDHFGAGEIGHIVVQEGGNLCRCGNRGCLETLSSSRAVNGKARDLFAQSPDSLLHQFAASPEQINTNIVLSAYDAGDEAVRRIITDAGKHLGAALSYLVSILDVEQVIIAGSLARSGDALLEPIRAQIASGILPELASNVRVDASELDQDIVILGAAALLLSNELRLT
ncbi:MAG: ROK family transcriptional regulator [Anaerolineae bacterium]|nr:ROK family transcriptional regulator [Anaerolineae bacterium]